MMPEEVAKLAQEQTEKVRRMTNQQLWDNLVGWTPESEFRPDLIDREFERRLRKIGFLPALPLTEEEAQKPQEIL